MKDRIGNKLEIGQKVLVALPDTHVFGFISEVKETGRIAGVKGHGGIQTVPGRVLVSCVIALPVDQEFDAVGQLVRVHDADKHESANVAAVSDEDSRPN